jgi:hypothetical protein
MKFLERSGNVDEVGNTRPRNSSQAIEGFLPAKVAGSNMQDGVLA